MKKILLAILIIILALSVNIIAVDITIGQEAADREDDTGMGGTFINEEITATGTGKITSVEIWANTELLGCEVAIFYRPDPDGFPDNFTTRDHETVQIVGQDPGVVPAGSKQTATVDLDVEEGDYLGIYNSNFMSGFVEADDSGYCWVDIGTDNIPCTNVELTYSLCVLSLYGTGTTEEEEEEANAIFFGTNF